MANLTGPRIRTNNVFGTLTDNPLTNVATTMNSAGLANLAAVSSAHAIIVLDPLRAAGAPEIVVVTAHTAAATSATITRAAAGTSAREHASGVLWVHAPTIWDAVAVCTASTRPSDTYEGQLIYETDTNDVRFWDGATWVEIGCGGQLAYAQVTANQASIGAGPTDLTSLTVTFTAAASRRYKITGHGQMSFSDATTGHSVDVLKDGTAIGRVWLGGTFPTSTTTYGQMDGCVLDTPTAASHTYKLTATRFVGSGTLSLTAAATNPAFILVEDIGSSL